MGVSGYFLFSALFFRYQAVAELLEQNCVKLGVYAVFDLEQVIYKGVDKLLCLFIIFTESFGFYLGKTIAVIKVQSEQFPGFFVTGIGNGCQISFNCR